MCILLSTRREVDVTSIRLDLAYRREEKEGDVGGNSGEKNGG